MNKLNKFKKNLRASQTDVENILWLPLRNRNMNKFKVRRQHILQGYIVDFVCLEKKLIIEIDGSQQDEQKIYVEIRTEKFTSEGFSVIRFWNNEILDNLPGVLESIYNLLEDIKTPLTRRLRRRPLPQGEG